MLGRTYVHGKVYEAIINAYKVIETSAPNKFYVYGETGHKGGGRFRPHKTHQNGLSVDFMVPVLDEKNRSVPLPTGVFNKFGYSIEFDKTGRYEEYRIDFEAIASHLYALSEEAKKSGINIKTVIFDAELQEYLFKTQKGAYLKANIRFSKKPSWVRHDEHYHVDFDADCKLMEELL